MAINALGAFVHTLRLQYVEFFPKFLAGGGRAFEPLNKKYEHIYITKKI
jgi:V/A-type H+-transporting ATPase subunit I